LVCSDYSRCVTLQLDTLHRRIRRAFRASGETLRAYGRGLEMGWGYETRQTGSRYYWEGAHRGTSAQPRVLFQYTLSGHGEFAVRKKSWDLGSEDGFTALLPSVHRYFLPKASPHWTFFWFIVRHPLVAERIRDLHGREEQVQHWPHQGRVVQEAAALFETACAGHLRNIWSFEERLFAWLWAVERELYQRRYPSDPREKLLEETRRIVLRRLEHPPSSTDLAAAYGLDRSTFSRKFRATTGLTPIGFVTEVRLEEALKLLRTKAKLEAIAAQTGFADATHFCKVFQRLFRSTPGSYRNLVR
jgi:AraC-like DNA-binding protein